MIDHMHGRLAAMFAGGFLAAWCAAVGLVLAAAGLPDAARGRMLAVFPPGLPAQSVAARIGGAGGVPVEPAAGGLAWIVYARDAGFAGRLRAAGALLVVPPLGDIRFAGGCGTGMELLAARRPPMP